MRNIIQGYVSDRGLKPICLTVIPAVQRFAAVVLRLREPKATALVFSSGKMVVNGARSEDDARLASRKFARIIQKLGYPEATFKEFKIHNVVASSDIRMRLRLNDLRMGHRAHTDVGLPRIKASNSVHAV